MKLFKRIFYFLVLLSVALLSISFAMQNSTEVVLNYYIGSISSSLSAMITISFVSGAILAFVSGGFLVIKLRLKSTRCQKKLQNLERKYQKELSKYDKSKNNHQTDPVSTITKNTKNLSPNKAID